MKRSIIAILSMCIPFIMNGQECLWNYKFDPAETSGYTMSCGEVIEDAIMVTRNSCNFYTPLTSIPGSDEGGDKWLKFDAEFNGSTNLGEEDFIWIFFYVDGKTIDTKTLKGEEGKTSYYFSDSILIPAGGSFRSRIAFVCNEEDEYWKLSKNNLTICIEGDKKQNEIASNQHSKGISLIKERTFVKLRWDADPGSSPNYFKIERSTDGVQYSFTGFVKENNISTSKTGYTFIDSRPDKPKSWYRIKRVDQYGGESLIGEAVYIDL